MNLPKNNTKKKIALLSNITVGLIACKLHKKFQVYLPAGYDVWVSEVLNPVSEFYSIQKDAIFILLDGMEFGYWKDEICSLEKIQIWKEAITSKRLIGNLLICAGVLIFNMA